MSPLLYHKARPLSFGLIQQRLWAYAQLMRIHRPVGILLLLWPTLAALWLVQGGELNWRLIIVFTLGVVVMRSAGCVINDIADRHVDGRVQRTQDRPLVKGIISLPEAYGLFFILLVLACILVCLTNLFTIILSIGAGILACCYPFMKRYTHIPQLVLGMAFGFAIPMVYAAHIQSLPLACWILFLATVSWALAYDTLYAMVDREDDLNIGVKSTAIAFGRCDKVAVAVFHVLTLGLWALLGYTLHCGIYFFLGIVVAFILAAYQQWLIRERAPRACFQAFLNNQWFGMALFMGTVLDNVNYTVVHN